MMPLRSTSIAFFLTLATAAAALAQAARSDAWLESPVDDATFTTYLDFFAYDRRLPFELDVRARDEEDGVRLERISFLSTSGVRAMANVYRPAGRAPSGRPALLVIHGGTGAGKESMDVPARRLVRAGFDVMAMDLQHFGERATDLLTTFTEQEKHDRLYNQQAAYLAWVAQTVKDAGRAFDVMVEHFGADPARVGLVGYSRGAQMGTIVAGADRRFAAVALLYGGHFDRFETGHRAPACPANYIGRISPRPLFLLNGEHDSDYFKDSSVLPLHRHAKEPKTVVWADTGHQYPTPEHFDRLTTWLQQAIR